MTELFWQGTPGAQLPSVCRPGICHIAARRCRPSNAAAAPSTCNGENAAHHATSNGANGHRGAPRGPRAGVVGGRRPSYWWGRLGRGRGAGAGAGAGRWGGRRADRGRGRCGGGARWQCAGVATKVAGRPACTGQRARGGTTQVARAASWLGCWSCWSASLQRIACTASSVRHNRQPVYRRPCSLSHPPLNHCPDGYLVREVPHRRARPALPRRHHEKRQGHMTAGRCQLAQQSSWHWPRRSSMSRSFGDARGWGQWCLQRQTVAAGPASAGAALQKQVQAGGVAWRCIAATVLFSVQSPEGQPLSHVHAAGVSRSPR